MTPLMRNRAMILRVCRGGEVRGSTRMFPWWSHRNPGDSESIDLKRFSRAVTYYLVEWELPHDETQTSWEPQHSLVKQGLQHFIDDYENRQLETRPDLELGVMFSYVP